MDQTSSRATALVTTPKALLTTAKYEPAALPWTFVNTGQPFVKLGARLPSLYHWKPSGNVPSAKTPKLAVLLRSMVTFTGSRTIDGGKLVGGKSVAEVGNPVRTFIPSDAAAAKT